jgi:hypothetical protein
VGYDAVCSVAHTVAAALDHSVLPRGNLVSDKARRAEDTFAPEPIRNFVFCDGCGGWSRAELPGCPRCDSPSEAEDTFAPVHVDAQVYADLTLRCPVCGRRADVCFDHGDDWKKRP